MIQLSREIRFALAPKSEVKTSHVTNSWAGWPTTNLIVPRLRLQLILSGEPDPITGYLCNIKIVDDLLREIVMQRLIPDFHPMQTAEQLIQIVAQEVESSWNVDAQLDSVLLHLSPQLRFRINFAPSSSQTQPGAMTTTQESSNTDVRPDIIVTEQFEFSAAHRLHCESLDEERNRELFGKCNNPEGHGHNYVVEVSVAGRVESELGQVIPLHEFEMIVKKFVIDRLDHKHLNRDVEYFKDVNPSVENIAVAIYRWLDGQFGNARLASVKVFETPKTWAEFHG
ncbi:MAG: 6-carboxytetrahydropterin synthase [Planctomycetota bacterium]